MCERSKIHVFLGAPPPPSSVCEAGAEPGAPPPAGWRQLELTWTDRRLRPVTGEAFRDHQEEEHLTGEAFRDHQEEEHLTGEAFRDHQEEEHLTGEAFRDHQEEEHLTGEAFRDHQEEEHLTGEAFRDRQEEEHLTGEAFRDRQEEEHLTGEAFRDHQEEEHLTAGSSRDDADRVAEDQTDAGQDEAGRTGAKSGGGAPTRRHVDTEKRKLSSEDRQPANPLSPEDQSDGEKEDGCSASVLEYLDVCFPAAPPAPREPGPPRSDPAACSTTQYLSTWTLSQALHLRGRHSSQSARSPAPHTTPTHAPRPASVSSSTPELFSPEPASPGASAELFSQICSSPAVQEGGVVLQAAADFLLCSQDAASPVQPPRVKTARLSEDTGTEAPSREGGPTTPLARCQRAGVRYSVLVAVVHPCHLKEVKVKSGPAAGSFVPLASVVVTDQSGVEVKVVLWRRAAFWALTVSPGDALLITGLQVNEDRWRGETVLQSSFCSRLLNLGHIAACTSPPALQLVDARSLAALREHLRERRPLLLSLPSPAPQDLTRLPYSTLRSLRVNTLVHALLRVTRTHISSEWRSEAESCWRSAAQTAAVLSVEQPDGHQGALLLWGAAVDWLPRFNRGRAAVWDFHMLLVREGLTSDLPELHSTPWSSVRPLDPRDRRAQHFLSAPRHQAGSSLELDLETLLSQKHSGDVELRVHVTAFHFQGAPSSQNAPGPVLDGCTPLAVVLETLSGDVTYAGCARCSAELGTDANGIYSPCYPCLPHTAVRRFYRPGVLAVSGRGYSRAWVQVPPVPLEKILGAPPDRLHRSSAPGSQVKHIQVAAERILSLVSLPQETLTLTVRSHFLCDENSVPLSQDLTLLDLQFPGGRARPCSRWTEEP